MKRKGRTTKDVLKEQEAQAKAARENVLVAAKRSTALTPLDGSNPWIEIGTELDKYLGAPLLKFTKQGEFAISDLDTIPVGTHCITHCDKMEIGWIKWIDGRPSSDPGDRKLGLVADGFIPPKRSDLPDTDETQWEIEDGEPRDPWAFQMSVPLTLLNAGGETYKFVTPSKGGLRCLSGLTRAYGKRVQAKGDAAGQPVVELRSDSYKHRKYGKIFYPVMHIVGWTGPDGNPLSLVDDIEDTIPDFSGKAA
jgi:hypothetical protein